MCVCMCLVRPRHLLTLTSPRVTPCSSHASIQILHFFTDERNISLKHLLTFSFTETLTKSDHWLGVIEPNNSCESLSLPSLSSLSHNKWLSDWNFQLAAERCLRNAFLGAHTLRIPHAFAVVFFTCSTCFLFLYTNQEWCGWC